MGRKAQSLAVCGARVRVLPLILLVGPMLAGCTGGDDIEFTQVWDFRLPRVGFASPLAVDLDGDGVLDVVAGAGPWGLVDNREDPRTRDLVALRGSDGAMLWTLETGATDASPAAADLDGDGDVELVTGLREQGHLRVLGLDGSQRSTHALQNWVHTPALADADGDGSLEIFVVAGGQEDHSKETEPGDPGGRGKAGRVTAHRGHDLGVLWSADLPMDAYSSPAVGPLGHGGRLAVVYGMGGEMAFGGGVFARDAVTGDLLWSEETRTGVVASPALANLDGDDRADVVFVEWWGMVHARSAQGDVLWDAQTHHLAFTSPALAYLNDDDRHDVVVTGMRRSDHHEDSFEFLVNGEGALSYASEGLIRAYDGATGEILWSRSVSGAPGTPVTADLTDDGDAEVIVVVFNGKKGVLGADGGRLLVLDGTNGKTLANRQLISGAAATPTVTDIDHDGYPDIIIATTAPARVLRLESDTRSEPAVPGSWPMWRGNVMNTGIPAGA